MPKISGYEFIDGREISETVKCVHCGAHWTIIPGSGRKRGWCLNCNGPYCGEKCKECLPFEEKLSLYEKGKLASL